MKPSGYKFSKKMSR